MATANLDPLSAARMARQQKRLAALSSPDPVTRYHAREAAISDAAAEAGKALARQADINAKEYQRIINQPEKSRYKPMTSRNIIKEKE